MAGVTCQPISNAINPISGTTCNNESASNASSTDPSLNTNCPNAPTSTLSSGSPGGMTGLVKTTQMVNQCTAPVQTYRQVNPPIQPAGVPGFATGGTPTCAVPNNGTAGTGATTTGCTTGNPTGAITNPPTAGSTNTCAFAGAGVPGTAAQTAQNQQISCTMSQQAKGATLPASATLNPTLIQNSSCQELNPNGYNVNSTGLTVTPATGGTAQTAPNACTINPATYQACTVSGKTPQMTAAQANACPNAILSNQIQDLTGPLAQGQIPSWAQPSVTNVNQTMAARGIGSSTVAGQGLFNAIQTAALPIATGNASYYATLQAANLTNAQQAAVVNQQSAMQSLLSDQSAVNAAAQFNATSENQTSQFMANLNSQIQLSNAAQANAMSQFNAGQTNSVNEFNGNLQNQINQFNAQNQLAIDQSNVTWRRNINTSNTAATNAANQVNTQNAFNLTATAQNNLWQQMQDQASWANTDAQNALTRQQNMAIASLGTQTAFNLQSAAGQQQFFQYLGQFGLDVFNSVTSS